MKTLYIFVLVLITFVSTAWSKEIPLFFIERNKNKNEVHYQLQVNENCQIVSDKPITGYWKVLEESSDKTKPLSVFDKMAYNVTNQKVENNWVFFNLKAFEARLIKATVKQDSETGACESIVQTKINNKWSLLDHIYVFAKGGSIMPKVIYVDIIGKGLEDKSNQVTERIKP